MTLKFNSQELRPAWARDTNPSYLCAITNIIKGRSVSRSSFDLDVWLTSFGVNLQRSFVWTIEQQSAFIESLVYRDTRTIPPLAVAKLDTDPMTYKVIDGKQRLTTIFNWLEDKVPLHFKRYTLLRSEMPVELRVWIEGSPIRAYIYYDLDDTQLIEAFNLINFSGTPQDESHKVKLLELIK